MSTFLQRILARKRVELAERRAALPEAALERLAAAAPPPRDVVAALEPNRLGVIAEVKRASPSKGAIALDLDAVTQARRYAEGGADAISVLTDEAFYHGSLDDLRTIRAAVPTPVLRKDFILDRYGLLEARAAGADLVLLIVAALEARALSALVGEALVRADDPAAVIRELNSVPLAPAMMQVESSPATTRSLKS